MTQKQCVYVDLDSLLDTRIATVSAIDQEAAVRLVKSPDYYTRNIDDFEPMCGVTREAFDEAYAKRNVDTLKRALPCNIMVAMRELVDGLVKQDLMDPETNGVEVVINMWPYVDLSDKESYEITRAIMYHMGIRPQVRHICIAPESLTPQYIKSSITGLIMYDFAGWFKIQGDALVNCRMPDVTVLTPALFRDKRVPTAEEATVPKLKGMTPFEILEFSVVQAIGLTMIDVGYFSLLSPHTA